MMQHQVDPRAVTQMVVLWMEQGFLSKSKSSPSKRRQQRARRCTRKRLKSTQRKPRSSSQPPREQRTITKS